MRKKSLVVSLITVLGMACGAGVALATVTGVLAPTGDGYYQQFVKSTGTYHYQNVDETPCNGVTDYNYTTSTGARDSYVISLASLPGYATITQIEIVPCASKHIASKAPSNMKVFYRWNGVKSSDAGIYGFSAISNTPTQLSTTTYSGLSLAKTPASVLEIGAIYYSGTAGLRLGNIKARITY